MGADVTAQTGRSQPTRTVRATAIIDAPPAQVWQALVEPERSRQWYFGTAIRSTFEPDAPVDCVDDKGGVQIRGMVVEVGPERLLEPWGSGMTRVSIEHSGIPVDTQTEAELEQGATVLLSSLRTLLETGAPLRTA